MRREAETRRTWTAASFPIPDEEAACRRERVLRTAFLEEVRRE